MKTVRAAAVAKHIGITSLQLRRFLEEVNFGVKPADREFPINLVPGIVRFASRKLKKEIPPFEVDEEDLYQDEEKATPAAAATPVVPAAPKPAANTALQKLNEMGKRKVEVEKPKPRPAATAGKPTAIFRKIEVDPVAAAAAKKAREENMRKSKEEKEAEARERKLLQQKKKKGVVLVKKEGMVEIPATISIKEFSEKVGVPAGEIISVLMKNGMLVTLTQAIDFESLALIADEIEVQIKKEEEQASAEAIKEGDLEAILADDKENMKSRPPVVVVMGHVDHGKTSILDVIRETKVVDGEAGGITQHIGAYKVTQNDQEIAFLDTPGHAAFTAMRARGAKVADVAILVVAADEGIKPQTIEAINHAKEAGMPIIVAINKMDKPDANPDKVKGELAEHELVPEDWGGEVPCIPVSALKKEGIPDLLEMVLLQSEVLELTANHDRLAVATVIESHLDPALGPIATVMVNAGHLKTGDHFVIGEHAGKVRTMVNENGKNEKDAGPSTPVQLSGFSEVPNVGDVLQVFPNAKTAKQRAEELEDLHHDERRQKSGGILDIMASLQSGDMKFLKIVLKADAEGSLEAVRQAIEKIESPEARPKIIHAATGAVSESDVLMASASEGIVIGFHVLLTPRVKRIAEQEKVEIQNYTIIYELVDDISKILEGMLEAEEIEVELGKATVKQVFYTKKKMMIVGCGLTEGMAEQGAMVKIMRTIKGEEGDELTEVGTGKIAVLQHFEKKVKTLEAPTDCGIQFEGKVAIEEGDTLIMTKMESKLKTLQVVEEK